MLLQGKTAIVTGGAMGIGRGIAARFAAEGCATAIVDIAEREGKATADELSALGIQSVFLKSDVTNSRDVQEMVRKSIEKFGKIDILINSAGGVPGLAGGAISDITEEAWDRIIALNLKSVFLTCKAVIPHMRERRYGRIVNISSVGAVHPPAPLAHYHAAKGGVIALSANLALELARLNITVNSILPGPILTPFWTPVTKEVRDKEAFFAGVARREVPMQRMGTPEDVAGAAVFLASELSSYITGESIIVGGGLPLPVRGI